MLELVPSSVCGLLLPPLVPAVGVVVVPLPLLVLLPLLLELPLLLGAPPDLSPLPPEPELGLPLGVDCEPPPGALAPPG